MNIDITLEDLNSFSVYLVLAMLCINVALSTINFKKLDLPFRRLFYFLLLNFTIELFAFIFPYLGWNNLPLLHLYTLGEFIAFSYFYKSLLVKPKSFQRYFLMVISIGSLLIICNSIFVQSIFKFNTIAKGGVQVILIGYAVMYFYNLIEDRQINERRAKSVRLINSAVIIYYSGSLFIFMFSRFSFGNEDLYVIFWIFNSFLNLSFHVLIFTALWTAFLRKEPLSH